MRAADEAPRKFLRSSGEVLGARLRVDAAVGLEKSVELLQAAHLSPAPEGPRVAGVPDGLFRAAVDRVGGVLVARDLARVKLLRVVLDGVRQVEAHSAQVHLFQLDLLRRADDGVGLVLDQRVEPLPLELRAVQGEVIREPESLPERLRLGALAIDRAGEVLRARGDVVRRVRRLPCQPLDVHASDLLRPIEDRVRRVLPTLQRDLLGEPGE